jgi:hypothetical protein
MVILRKDKDIWCFVKVGVMLGVAPSKLKIAFQFMSLHAYSGSGCSGLATLGFLQNISSFAQLSKRQKSQARHIPNANSIFQCIISIPSPLPPSRGGHVSNLASLLKHKTSVVSVFLYQSKKTLRTLRLLGCFLCGYGCSLQLRLLNFPC